MIAPASIAAVADLVVDAGASGCRAPTGIDTVALSGGVFLNVLLTRLCGDRLRAGIPGAAARRVPPSDAGIALGQLVVGAQISTRKERAMCLAVPGAVLDIWEKDGTKMAKVDFGGVEKEVCCEFVPDIAGRRLHDRARRFRPAAAGRGVGQGDAGQLRTDG